MPETAPLALRHPGCLDDLEAGRAELLHLAAVSFRAFGSDEEARAFDRWPIPGEDVR